MRSLILILLAIAVLFQPSRAQFPSPEWALAGAGDRTLAIDIETDLNENIYFVAGYQQQSSFLGIPWTTPGIYGTAVTKLGPDGALHWSTTFSGSQLYTARNIAVSDDRILISGPLTGTLYYPGGTTFSMTGEDYVFICMDTSGNFQWIKQAQYATGSQVLADGSGGFYIGLEGGYPTQSLVLDQDTLQSGNLLAHLDRMGTFVWEKYFPNDLQYGFDLNQIAFTEQGNIALSGSFQDTLVLDNDTLYSHGKWVQDMNHPDSAFVYDHDIFCLELDASGNQVWKAAISGNGNEGNHVFSTHNGRYYFSYTHPFSNTTDTLAYNGDSIFIPASTIALRVVSLEPGVGLDWVHDLPGRKTARDMTASGGTLYLCGDDSTQVWMESLDLSPATWIESTSEVYSGYPTLAYTMHFMPGGELLLGGSFQDSLPLGTTSLTESGLLGNLFLAKFSNIWLDSPEPEPEPEFLVFPNPAQHHISIQTDGRGPFEAKLYTLHGQLCLQHRLSGSAEELDVSQLPRGAYLLQVQLDSGQITTKKVILQ